MELQLLKEVVIIFALAIVVLLACSKAKISSIVGLLVTGMIAGPHGLGLVYSAKEIEILAEIGVILLLFTIGVEFSLTNLLQIRRLVLIGGLAQVVLTVACGYGFGVLFGLSASTSLVLGLLVSLSSTALVLKVLQERAEIDTLHGRTTFAILIFQDIAIVPFLLFLPLMADGGGDAPTAMQLAKGAGLLVVVLGLAWVGVPKLLHQIARTASRELFLLSIVVICFVVAYIAYVAGLSLALGALLAGLIISESEYSHHALGSILPFQLVFTTLFFVSVGMLLDLSIVAQWWHVILGGALLVVVAKLILCIPSGILLGFPIRTAFLSAFALAQVGEFSFVLAKSALALSIIDQTFYQIFLSISVVTIAVSPSLMHFAPRFADGLLRLPIPAKLRRGWSGEADSHLFAHEPLRDHALIIGYGVTGRLCAQACEHSGISFICIEMDPDIVKSGRANQVPIVYGDATHRAVLQEEGAAQAKLAIIAISDAVATRQIVEELRSLNPSLYIIVRAGSATELPDLTESGANEVIPADFETAVEISGRLLGRYLVPRHEIDHFLREVRADGYDALRNPLHHISAHDLSLHLPTVDIVSCRVERGAPAIGQSLEQMQLRGRFGASLLAIRRGVETISNPPAGTVLESGDLLVVLGPIQNREGFDALLGFTPAAENY